MIFITDVKELSHMCGIVGYIGNRQAAPILLDGLAKLEYRGYDSAGIAVYNDGGIDMIKSKGRLKVLSELTHDGATLPGTLGIGHTRWATHGSPSDVNAHPHFNADKSIVVVHNGIIENYIKLKKKLEKRGYEFLSETDTEIIAHLLDYYYQGNPLQAITKIMHRMEGSYALGIIFKDHPEELYAVRKDSPLIVGHTDGGSIIASDVPAVLRYTRDVYFIENEEIVRMTKDSMEFYNVGPKDLDGIVNQLRNIEGIDCAIFMYETGTLEYKVSMRSSEKVNVAEVAAYFGGGGHARAAGCNLTGTFHDCVNNISLHIEKALKKWEAEHDERDNSH